LITFNALYWNVKSFDPFNKDLHNLTIKM